MLKRTVYIKHLRGIAWLMNSVRISGCSVLDHRPERFKRRFATRNRPAALHCLVSLPMLRRHRRSAQR
eukprot:COSAG02_NODE_3936_length_6021_cov_284.388551_4_plen_68_part_00